MKTYNQLYNKQRNYYQNERLDILQFVPRGIKRTLEFGCGQGNFSELLKKNMGVEAWAIEIDESAAGQAQNKIDRVINADVHEGILQVPDNYFDCIFFLDILEHLLNPYKLLEDVKKKLTPGGKVIVSVPNVRYWSVFRKYIWSGDWEYKEKGVMDITHLRFFTRKSIFKMFISSGYQIDQCVGINKTSRSSFKCFTFLTFGRFSDCAYPQYAIVAHI